MPVVPLSAFVVYLQIIKFVNVGKHDGHTWVTKAIGRTFRGSGIFWNALMLTDGCC